MKTNIILQGDALTKLKELPEKSINMCMTSPPYWALRDYGVDNQLGLESTFEEYIKKLCDIFDEVKRVLRDDGTCWVNLGDSYAGNMGKKSGWTDNKLDWVICGGESGPGARPMQEQWARDIKNRCVEAGIPFFLKQMDINGKLVKMPELDGRIWEEYPK